MACWYTYGKPITLRKISGLRDVVDVAMGDDTGCAVHRDGGVSCWGGNDFGQLGDGTTTNRSSPTRVKAPNVIPADEAPQHNRDLLLAWVDEEVENREAEFGWLRVAWDYSRDRVWVTPSGFGGAVNISCWGSGDSYRCNANSMVISDMELRIVVRELAHVYDGHTGLASSKAWGAVQLYFASAYLECAEGTYQPAEILADTLTHVVLPDSHLHYYSSSQCDALPELPSDDAEQVILDGLAGRVPDWYTENITDGAKLWAAWLKRRPPGVLANLAGEFGGFCSTDWITSPLNPDLFPAVGTNPFKDGGC